MTEEAFGSPAMNEREKGKAYKDSYVEGPWKYAGEIMPLSNTNSFTNHCGVADYKGHSYFFYHTGKLPKGGGFGRSVAVEEFKYNSDGSFPTIMPTDEGVSALASLSDRVAYRQLGRAVVRTP